MQIDVFHWIATYLAVIRYIHLFTDHWFIDPSLWYAQLFPRPWKFVTLNTSDEIPLLWRSVLASFLLAVTIFLTRDKLQEEELFCFVLSYQFEGIVILSQWERWDSRSGWREVWQQEPEVTCSHFMARKQRRGCPYSTDFFISLLFYLVRAPHPG